MVFEVRQEQMQVTCVFMELSRFFRNLVWKCNVRYVYNIG